MESGKDSCRNLNRRNNFWIYRPVLISFALLTLIVITSAYYEQTPVPLPPSAPLHLFSASRAYRTLQSVYLDNLPHPTGSFAQQQIGDRLVEYFKALGYDPEIQEVLVGSRTSHTFAVVRNIIVRLKGVHDDRGILVTAHYDSVPCGPGGMDDGVGVAAILELARVLRQDPPPNRSVIFLLCDGEEIGLLGAKAFIERHPWARKTQIVIGVDSGGDGGRSRVTEIARNEALLVKGIAEHVKRPSGSSAIDSVLNAFNLAEGESDFAEFKRAKNTGINLINSAWNYQRHTPRDDIAHIELGTLQDHGDHLLDLVKHLRYSKQVNFGSGKVIFFDLLGSMVVHYGQIWAWILQVSSLILIGVIGKRFGLERPLIGLRLLGKWFFVITTGIIGGALTGYLLVNLPQMPFLLKPALILLTAVWVELIASRYFKMEGTSAWVAWNFFGVITCIWLPGASYLFTIPALAMGLSSLILMNKTGDYIYWGYPWVFGLAALLWLPLFYVFIQFGAPYYLLSIPILVIVELILPLINRIYKHRFRLTLAGLLIILIIGPIYLWMRPVQPRPREYGNIVYLYQADRHQAYWLLPKRPIQRIWKPIGRVSYRTIDDPMFKEAGRIPVAKAPLINLPPPLAIIQSDTSITGGKRRLRLTLRSQSQARILRVAINPRPYSVSVNGLTVPSLPSNRLVRYSLAHHRPWEFYQFIGKMTKDISLEMTVPSHRKVNLVLTDQIDGLPLFGKKLLKARPSGVLPVQNGDLTLMAKVYHF